VLPAGRPSGRAGLFNPFPIWSIWAAALAARAINRKEFFMSMSIASVSPAKRSRRLSTMAATIVAAFVATGTLTATPAHAAAVAPIKLLPDAGEIIDGLGLRPTAPLYHKLSQEIGFLALPLVVVEVPLNIVLGFATAMNPFKGKLPKSKLEGPSVDGM